MYVHLCALYGLETSQGISPFAAQLRFSRVGSRLLVGGMCGVLLPAQRAHSLPRVRQDGKSGLWGGISAAAWFTDLCISESRTCFYSHNKATSGVHCAFFGLI